MVKEQTAWERVITYIRKGARSKWIVKVKVTLQLGVYRQSVDLCTKPLEDHNQICFFN
jgi:hypothetical protein